MSKLVIASRPLIACLALIGSTAKTAIRPLIAMPQRQTIRNVAKHYSEWRSTPLLSHPA